LPGKELQVSSPITFSGFNNIDFNVVVKQPHAAGEPAAELAADSAEKPPISDRRVNTLASQVAALRAAAGELRKPANLAMLAGTSSNDQAVKVAVDSTASVAQYDVIVNELARAQVTVSASGVPDSNTTIVASGGSITIGGVAVAITGDSTLQQVASAINGTAGIGVTAAVVRTGASSYRLALTGTQQGPGQRVHDHQCPLRRYGTFVYRHGPQWRVRRFRGGQRRVGHRRVRAHQ
jgi:flagellar hook-associated protein 2